MIDRQGYRPNVGIILCNDAGKVFWARRSGEDSWQFPQGGIRRNETPEQALYRELAEEVGLGPEHVEVIGRTARWLRYRIPRRYLRQQGRRSRCSTDKPEFDSWRWINCWETVDLVIPFKRIVYRRALEQLIPLINADDASAFSELP